MTSKVAKKLLTDKTPLISRLRFQGENNMGKTGLLVLILTVCVALLGVTVTNLVFTLIDRDNKSSEEDTTPKSNRPVSNQPVSNSSGFKEAGEQLLRGIDLSVDPCEDFYAFTCNKYLDNVKIPEGSTRIGTYDEAQVVVDTQIVEFLDQDDNDTLSDTEKVVKKVYKACVENSDGKSEDRSKFLNDKLKEQINGVPLLTENWQQKSSLLEVAAKWIKDFEIDTVIGFDVTADFKNVKKNALYLSAPSFVLPLDYYIKSTFLNKLDSHRTRIEELFQKFANSIDVKVDKEKLKKDVNELVSLEIKLAMNVVPNNLLVNSNIQYNKYNFTSFQKDYEQLKEFITNIVYDDVKREDLAIIVTQPRYFESLNTLLNQVEHRVVYNYLGYRYLLNFKDFIGGEEQVLIKAITQFSTSRKHKVSDDDKVGCVGTIKDWMPYGPGFIYVNGLGNDMRQQVVDDIKLQTKLVIEQFLKNVDSIEWMKASRKSVQAKAEELKSHVNIGYPKFFEKAFDGDYKELDQYHTQYINSILDDKVESYFDILIALGKAHQKTEKLGIWGKDVDRANFLDSPATVNAWYAPELNSITVPFAILNPPYYKLDYPQAYKYGGQGGTLGHELTHGFDSSGVQFGPDGSLSGNCNLEYCTWLNSDSIDGFLNMAQCVISQYNEQCCPLDTGNVHCANGENTQGENIADIGGQLAAYNAYRAWVDTVNDGKEEQQLPGLDGFTSNQVFWITYAFSWCMKQEQDNLVNQILTNEHAPGKCRVNQVMQDIPQFANDFGCKPKQALFPPEGKRCKVWTGV
ncbi:unnamed protein product [Bursaphelenchus okinawaensis]|uniref:Peptidase_M13 domain-containing protein n=1 Tax=Bursaphelenchus okinawaensis TaxID=465554 RepID=A0A811L7I7_9BILA|nr:unnamed protein product [Bursaphelenchus okinawaensis]CAG9119574.1 unnamed protein product [Bursaphelenchus okinawaensis]